MSFRILDLSLAASHPETALSYKAAARSHPPRTASALAMR